MNRRLVKLGPIVVAALLWSSLAAAVDPEEVYQAAVADFKAGNYAAACPKFAEARRLRPGSSAALQGLAQCYDKAGKTASAWGRYRELIVDLKSRDDAARAEAAGQRADELAKILSTVAITPASPDVPGLIIRLDQEEVPRAMFGTKMNVDPGPHALEATAPGHEVWRTTITIGDRNDARVVQVPALVSVAVSPPPPSAQAAPRWSPRRIAGVAVGGVGVAGLIVGGVFGGLTAKKVSDSKASCAPDLSWCYPAGYALQHDAKTTANVSNAAFAIGGAAVVAGVVLFVTAPSGAPAGAARVTIGPLAGADRAGVLVRGEW